MLPLAREMSMKVLTERIFDAINQFTEWLCYLLLTTLVVIVTAQVFLRYALHSPLSWAEEIALLLLVWFGMLAVAVAVYRHTHIAISVVWDRLPHFAQHIVNIGVELLIIFFALNICINAEILIKVVHGQHLPASQFSKAWLYYPLQFGGALMAFNAFGNIVLEHFPGRDHSISNFEV